MVHVVEPPVDPSLTRELAYSARGIGPTEVALRWPYDLAGQINAGVIVERRRADQTEWRAIGMFDHLNAQYASSPQGQMLFTIDRTFVLFDRLRSLPLLLCDNRRPTLPDERLVLPHGRWHPFRALR